MAGIESLLKAFGLRNYVDTEIDRLSVCDTEDLICLLTAINEASYKPIFKPKDS